MAVASRYQVPRSRVLGRPARARTIYYYDEATGRLTHSETTWESEWDEDDFDWAVGHMAEEADRCPGCHRPLSETTDPAAEGRYEVSALRCHACTPLEQEKEKWATAAPGLLFEVQPRSMR